MALDEAVLATCCGQDKGSSRFYKGLEASLLDFQNRFNNIQFVVSLINSSAVHTLQLLRWVLAIYFVWKKTGRSLSMVDVSSVHGVPDLMSSSITCDVLFRSVESNSCVGEPVRLKTGRGVMWSMIFKVMNWSTADVMLKERESVLVRNCELFTLQRAGNNVVQ